MSFGPCHNLNLWVLFQFTILEFCQNLSFEFCHNFKDSKRKKKNIWWRRKKLWDKLFCERERKMVNFFSAKFFCKIFFWCNFFLVQFFLWQKKVNNIFFNFYLIIFFCFFLIMDRYRLNTTKYVLKWPKNHQKVLKFNKITLSTLSDSPPWAYPHFQN